MRERLQSLISEAFSEYSKTDKAQFIKTFITDYLIENGVIVPPCKVGDTVYHLKEVYKGKKIIDTIIEPLIVDSFIIGDLGRPQANICDIERNVWIYYDITDFGRVVFLTRGEAERALKEAHHDEL